MAPPHNSTLIDENLNGFPSSQELHHYSPILGPGIQLHRRNKSISVHGSISTLEQGNKDIPIWVENKPRYVTGVTSRTTCNDIIKALIDDEVYNGNYAYSREGITQSRDYSDYVITECWRGVERSYEGNMAILPVWKAWSRVHNELRLSLKRQSEVVTHSHKKTIPRRALTSIRKYLTKLLKLLTRKKKSSTGKSEEKINKNRIDHKSDCHRSKTESDVDELLFVILPDKQYNNQTISKVDEEQRRLKERLYRLSEKPKKKRCNSFKRLRTPTKISKFSNDHNRRRRDMPIRSLLRNQIAQKTSEMDQLFNKESHLLKELTVQCRQYKLQNELYTNQDKQLEISIGQIQSSIEAYAQEILKTEKELFEIKNEIKNDISIINNLKRMTFEQRKDCVRGRSPSTWDASVVRSTDDILKEQQMQFVDNIYEFCDNNASMLV